MLRGLATAGRDFRRRRLLGGDQRRYLRAATASTPSAIACASTAISGWRCRTRSRPAFYASATALDQQLPGALTSAVALTAPRNRQLRRQPGAQHLLDPAAEPHPVRLGRGLAGSGRVRQRQVALPLRSSRSSTRTRSTGVRSPGSTTRGPVRADARRRGFGAAAPTRSNTSTSTGSAARKCSTPISMPAPPDVYGELRATAGRAAHADRRRASTPTASASARAVVSSTAPMQDGRIAFDQFSPKFGVLFEPAADVQLFANYSRSAEFPGMGEVFQTVAGVSLHRCDPAAGGPGPRRSARAAARAR